jgi:hypothetical protein
VAEQKVKSKLLELSKRAALIKSDANLRHSPNDNDIRKAFENARLMQSYQYSTIKSESGEDQ